MSGFVTTCQAEVVVLSVDSDVLVVLLAQFLDGGVDGLDASGFAHGFRAVVGVAASTVPVALERLGMEGNLDTPLFGDADKEVASHPEVVTHGNTFTGADLEFPLRGHDLSVDSADVDASVEAGAVVSLNEITGKDLAGT